jgi:dihydrofolate synthase / folylpolyglutamate synthase
VDAAHNPAGMAAAMEAITETFTFSRLVGVLAVAADKDVPPMLDQLEPVVSDLIVTRNSSPRSMEVAKLADLSEAVFGPDRVHSAPRLDQAIEEAVTLADEAEAAGGGSEGMMPGTAAVLIVGSVITAGDARALLLPTGQAGELGQSSQGGASTQAGREPADPEPEEPDTP